MISYSPGQVHISITNMTNVASTYDKSHKTQFMKHNALKRNENQHLHHVVTYAAVIVISDTDNKPFT